MIKLLPSEYATEGVFQLHDLEQLIAKWRQAHGCRWDAIGRLRPKCPHPKTLLLGRFENEIIGWFACCGGGKRYRLVNRAADAWRDGDKRPFMRFLNLPYLKVKVLPVEHHCELR